MAYDNTDNNEKKENKNKNKNTGPILSCAKKKKYVQYSDSEIPVESIVDMLWRKQIPGCQVAQEHLGGGAQIFGNIAFLQDATLSWK